MRTTRAVLLAALTLAGCGKPEFPATTADSAATALNATLPQDMGAGMIVSSASSEGAVLVLKLDNLVARGAGSTDETAENVRGFACRNATYRTLISHDIEIRFDPTDTSGRDLPPVTLDGCP